MLFLTEADHGRYSETMRETLQIRLPETFRGYPVIPVAPTGNLTVSSY